MLKILKFLVSLGCLGLFVWWGATVPLGDRTLFGHLWAIGQSQESQELVRGTRRKVSEVTKRLARDEEEKDGKEPAEAPGPPQENLTAEDRQQMRRLLESARAKPSP